MQPVSVEFDDRVIRGKDQEMAPYNGYGTIEDSLGSCRNLILKPPKKDFIKMLDHENKVLRFVARMITKHKEDNDRRFVISYKLADDTISIYEPPQRNAGVLGGKFLERTKVLKNLPKSSLSSVSPLGISTTPEYFKASDLFIGASLEINRHKFVLLDADEFVMNYMAANPKEFPLSDVSKIKATKADKVDALKQFDFTKLDKNGSGVLDRKDILVAVKQEIHDGLEEQVILYAW